MSTTRYYLGVDVGYSVDYCAMVLVESRPATTDAINEGIAKPGDKLLAVRSIERGQWPQTELVERIEERYRQPELAGRLSIAVDVTGLGHGVGVELHKKNILHRQVIITSGHNTNVEGREWRIPKKILISGLSSLLYSGRLMISPALPLADILRRELEVFDYTIGKGGHEKYSAKSGEHDDVVLATSYAAHMVLTQPIMEVTSFGPTKAPGFTSPR